MTHCPSCGRYLRGPSEERDLDKMTFFQLWKGGLIVALWTIFAFGVAALAGGLCATAVYSILVVLPSEIIYHSNAAEEYFPHVAVLGIAIFGVYLIGRVKGNLIEALVKN
jgi:hypothetical protein